MKIIRAQIELGGTGKAAASAAAGAVAVAVAACRGRGGLIEWFYSVLVRVCGARLCSRFNLITFAIHNSISIDVAAAATRDVAAAAVENCQFHSWVFPNGKLVARANLRA